MKKKIISNLTNESRPFLLLMINEGRILLRICRWILFLSYYWENCYQRRFLRLNWKIRNINKLMNLLYFKGMYQQHWLGAWLKFIHFCNIRNIAWIKWNISLPSQIQNKNYIYSLEQFSTTGMLWQWNGARYATMWPKYNFFPILLVMLLVQMCYRILKRI